MTRRLLGKRRRLERRIKLLERKIARTKQVQLARRAMLRKLRDPSTPADELRAVLEFCTNERL